MKLSQDERDQARIAKRQAETGRERRLAGLDYDPRTASGRRELVIHDLAQGRRARAASYGTLIRNKAERTPTRVQAMRLFDQMCHGAYAGMLPEPRFLPRVDESASRPGRPDNRAEGLRQMQRLVARVGEEAHALLIHRVFLRMQFTAMSDAGHGDERALSVLFVAAIDAAARFYGLEEASIAVQDANRILGEGDLREPSGLVHQSASSRNCASSRPSPRTT